MRAKLSFGLKLIIFLLLLIPILELGVRVMIPQQLIKPFPGYTPDDTGLGVRMKANMDMVANTGDGSARILTDEHGFRIGEDGPCEADTRILALGDSYLQAIQVDYESTTTGQLERILTDQRGAPVCVFNTGVPAYDPNHYRIFAKRELAAAYDMVIVFVYAGNDIITKEVEEFKPSKTNTIHEFRMLTSLNKNQIVNRILYPINDRLERNSHLFILFKDRSSVQLARLGLTAYYFPEHLLTTADPERWPLTANTLADIVQEANQYDIPAIIVLLPSIYQVDQNRLDWAIDAFGIKREEVDLAQPGRRLQDELQRYDIELIDLLPEFREEAAQGTVLFGRIDTHLSPAGHTLVADALAPIILDKLD
ncbi:MAG: SGNH/GDSL hydrolase family protein [Anaerolineae bacterium]|nr:SGNH/GDSL hydrolase family protein [Anaerolineae bacterium]